MSLPRFLRRHRISWKVLTFLAICACVAYYYSQNNVKAGGRSVEMEISDDIMQLRRKRFERYQNSEQSREGPGEKGAGVHLTGKEKERADSLMDKEAFNIVASDKISLERSVKDVRDSR